MEKEKINIREVEFIEIPKAKCKICGSEKECVKLKYKGKFLKFFDTNEEIVICETCLSYAFRQLRKDK